MASNRALRNWVLSDAQKEILHMVGFGVFANPAIVLQNNTRLVSALVERWRPETNTFFMRQGEMTVTLEDVGYILGLPVMGRPFVGDGIDGNQSYFERAWFEELTPEQVKEGYTRGGVRLTWLFETYGSADPGPDLRCIAVHTQAYMFFVVGSILFPTSSRNVVHPRYIRHLRTLSHVRTWSWGSAVLSYLYRGLSTAAQKGSKKIPCCVWLLMLWSYERFDIGRPIPDPSRDSYPVAEFWARPDEIELVEEEVVEVQSKGKKGKTGKETGKTGKEKGMGKGKGKEELKGKGSKGKTGKVPASRASVETVWTATGHPTSPGFDDRVQAA
nr:PREDICTED: serine/threonine-protein phosphatase 7 long form homolog [Daucus carota subsp. sativus]